MIYKNNKAISGVFINDRAIGAIYKGTQLVWQAIRSCFGRGFWIPSKPWIETDSWKY